MRLLRNTSIRSRLTYIIMSVSGISVLLTTLAISIIGVYSLRGNIANQLSVSASIVGDRNTAALLFNDDKQAASNLNVFSVNHTVRRACLYKENGALFARYDNHDYPHRDCSTDLRERIAFGKDDIEVMKPIIDKTHATVGYIFIDSTLEEIENYIARQIIIAITVASTALLISWLLAISLQRAISRPILRLADTAREISLHKDYSIRATPLGDARTEDKNELVILTDSFNAMLTEINERNQQLKQQNAELEKARDAAESANRSKSQFLANISHELRTPLNAIIGFSSILMNQLFGPLGDQKYLEYACDINESGVHLLDIINDILDLSKAEAGKLTLSYEEVHVGKAIAKCVTILAERAAKGKVAVSTSVPKTLPPLHADRLRFIQIVLNILSNAIKFTEEGGRAVISAHTQDIGGEPANLIVSIEDTGIGMSPEDIGKAFQSFGQLDSGLNRKYEGTGLGLPLTRKLMELHHGAIAIESELGKGTIVTLTFPLLPPSDAESADKQAV